MTHQARKRFGQNFLQDSGVIYSIVAAINPSENMHVIEIGPGLGALTRPLLSNLEHLDLLEIDRDLVAYWNQENLKGLNVIEGDALKFDFLEWANARSANSGLCKVVGNLPYNISVPVLLNFMERFPSIKKGLVLVQAEVADRLAAKSGSKVYGSPSAKLAWYGHANLAGNVARSIFWPVPNVDSSLVYFERSNDARGSEELRKATFAVIDAAFGQRRKTLRQALSEWAGSPAAAENRLLAAGVSPQLRGEQLNIDQFVKIASSHG